MYKKPQYIHNILSFVACKLELSFKKQLGK